MATNINYTIGTGLSHTHSIMANNSYSTGLQVAGTIKCDDIEIGNAGLKDTLKEINQRLSILHPKPEHLEKHIILADLYEQYQVALALLYGGEE